MIVDEGEIPEDWKNSVTVPFYKGKEDALECLKYRGIRLLVHGMKLFEKVLEERLRKLINVDGQQFGSCPGRSKTDAIFIMRYFQEKFSVCIIKIKGENNSRIIRGLSHKSGVHQGSALNPLLFITVMEEATKFTRGDGSWELLYADDSILTAESKEEVTNMFNRWKEGMEQRGLKRNTEKTKW